MKFRKRFYIGFARNIIVLNLGIVALDVTIGDTARKVNLALDTSDLLEKVESRKQSNLNKLGG